MIDITGPVHLEYLRAQADVAEVRLLCPLPDTAHEPKCVARSLQAPLAEVLSEPEADLMMENLIK